MTQLHFLSAAEKRKFDLPPVFTHEQRPAYFIVTDDIRRTLSALRSDTNKIGFLLQLGYFRHSGRFFGFQNCSMMENVKDDYKSSTIVFTGGTGPMQSGFRHTRWPSLDQFRNSIGILEGKILTTPCLFFLYFIPYLYDPNTERGLFESDDILAYLRENYAA